MSIRSRQLDERGLVYGAIESPYGGEKVPRREISVAGHLFSTDGDDFSIDIYVDGKLSAKARWGLPRYDVFQQHMIEPAYSSGFVVRCPLENFPGTHKIIAKVTVEPSELEFRLGPIIFSSGKSEVGDFHVPRKITPAGKPGAYKSFGLEFLELLREQGGLRSDHTVLEIGCGIGRCAAPLTKFLDADSKYYGVDVVREVVGYCTDHITARYPNFHFRHINVENAMYNPSAEVSPRATSLPLKSNTVDTVFLWSVFTHMKPSDIASYLCDICRVLRPGGRLLASYFLMTEGRLKDGCKIGVVSFDHEMDGFWTRRPDQPEQALAVFEPFIIEAYNIAGLSLEKVVYCEPSNPKTIAKQDVIVASKK